MGQWDHLPVIEVVRIERSILIAHRVEEVFAMVADARRDPQWCPKVCCVKQIEGVTVRDRARA